MSSADYQDWLPLMREVAEKASEKILEFYENISSDNLLLRSKADHSPLTEADLQANRIIEAGLSAIDPSIPFLSEESEEIPFEVRSSWRRYWLVDPLDGTKEFLRKSGEFSINIALIEDGKPVIGLVFVPVSQTCYWAYQQKAYFQVGREKVEEIHTRSYSDGPLRIAVSASSSKEKHWLSNLQPGFPLPYELINLGSALKICLVAKGEVDLYPRMGQTGEWDTAAGQCILEAAGGMLVDLQGKPLTYNQKPSLMNPPFLATSCVDLLAKIVDKSASPDPIV